MTENQAPAFHNISLSLHAFAIVLATLIISVIYYSDMHTEHSCKKQNSEKGAIELPDEVALKKFL